MRRTAIYIPHPQDIDQRIDQNEYDQVAPDEIRSISSESDLAESPAGQTIRSSYKSPIFDTPLEPCPVNGCPLNPQSGYLPGKSEAIFSRSSILRVQIRVFGFEKLERAVQKEDGLFRSVWR